MCCGNHRTCYPCRYILCLAVLFASVLPRSHASPQGVHLSLDQSGAPVVSWSAELPHPDNGAELLVRYAEHDDGFRQGKIVPASVHHWRDRLWGSAALTGLEAGRSYLYECSDAGGEAYGRKHKMELHPANPVRFAIFGDLAEGHVVGPSIVGNVTTGPEIHAVLHLGDIAGNMTDDDFLKGDRFLEMVEPLASTVPYMTLPGDRDNLTAYQKFFRMPTANDDDPWYSFAIGSARIVMLWTEGLRRQDKMAARQLRWLRASLQEFDSQQERRKRPWLIVAGHRPMYCSLGEDVCGEDSRQLRLALEDLLVMYHVDLYLAAHVHAYERTFAVRRGKMCAKDTHRRRSTPTSCGPIHILNGVAGEPALQDDSALAATWTAQRNSGSPGWGELTIVSGTRLEYRQLRVVGVIDDQFTLTKAAPPGPPKEDFLEAVFWLAVAIFGTMGTCVFIKWAHADGLKRRDEAMRNLRVELSVLSGNAKILGASREAEGLIGETSTSNLH